ncbi:MAG: PilZ domain-containing protein [Pseudobdellovibrio sp.]
MILTVTKHGGNFEAKRSNLSSEQSAIWSLHNSLKSWTLYNLTEEQVALLVQSLSDTELKLIKVSQKNDKNWKSLAHAEYPQFFEKQNVEQYYASENYPSLEIRNETVSETNYFVIKPNRVVQPRMHKRYEVAVSCILVGSSNQEFTAETIDLSEGGLYFKETIPSWIAGYFLVIVKSKFQLMCSLVEDQKEKKRVQIVSEESDFNFIQYKNWLNQL